MLLGLGLFFVTKLPKHKINPMNLHHRQKDNKLNIKNSHICRTHCSDQLMKDRANQEENRDGEKEWEFPGVNVG